MHTSAFIIGDEKEIPIRIGAYWVEKHLCMYAKGWKGNMSGVTQTDGSFQSNDAGEAGRAAALLKIEAS